MFDYYLSHIPSRSPPLYEYTFSIASLSSGFIISYVDLRDELLIIIVADCRKLPIPSISVEWYKKAMGGGMILDSPTIFGAAGGKLLGAGEAGSETVVGTKSLMEMIRRAVESVSQAMTINYGGVTINVYSQPGQDISALADEIEDRINSNVMRRRAAFT